jgi:flagellar secretion chaperone FliS
MSYRANPVNAYREARVKTAGQGQIIVMLYDEALRQIDAAVSELENSRRFDLVNNSIVKTQEIVTELMASLDFDQGGQIAQSLFSLYLYFNGVLRDANMKKEAAPLKTLRPMLYELRSAWQQVAGVSGSGQGNASSGSAGINFAG